MPTSHGVIAGDVDAAIARVEESRQTHVEWLSYWRDYEAHECNGEPCPWEAVKADQEAIAGDVQHQERAIAGYDNVLVVLRSLKAARHA